MKLIKASGYLVCIILMMFCLVLISAGTKREGYIFLIATIVLFILVSLIKLPKENTSSKPVAQMTGLEFEHYCAAYLVKTGRFTNVVVTPPSGDFGADIVAYDRQGDKWVFQCKHYQSKVPNDAVQEVVAAKAHYRANKGAVMTNSQLQKKAKQLAMENDIELFEMIDD